MTARRRDQIRTLRIEPGWLPSAEGSALVTMGRTRVLCAASVEEKTPPFLRGQGRGWVTAEYAMLPRATNTRTPRQSSRGGPDARSLEIGRLVGRSLRAATDLAALGERTITVDCDVLEADGGTRCASVTGGMVALAWAIRKLEKEGKLTGPNPLRCLVAAVSVGWVDGKPVLDLDYDLDHRADVDLNVVMDERGRYVEVQGTAEGEPFSETVFGRLRRLAGRGIRKILAAQRSALPRR